MKEATFPAADWTEDQGRPERSHEDRDPKPSPSEMMDDVEPDLAMQRSCYPERRLLPQQIVRSEPFWLLSLFLQANMRVRGRPTNYFSARHPGERRWRFISMGWADEHTDLMTKAMCLGRTVQPTPKLGTTIGGAWRR